MPGAAGHRFHIFIREEAGLFDMARNESDLEKALKNPRIKSQYMKEVERLFNGPKGDPEHDRDLQCLHDAYGTSRFGKQAREYIKKYGLPDDWGALLLPRSPGARTTPGGRARRRAG